MNVIHAWVALSAIGLFLSGWLVRESILDLRSISNRFNGRRIAARSRLIREAMRAAVHAVYLLIGVPLLDADVALTFVVLGLMFGNLAMVINSVVDASARRALIQPRDELGRFTKE